MGGALAVAPREGPRPPASAATCSPSIRRRTTCPRFLDHVQAIDFRGLTGEEYRERPGALVEKIREFDDGRSAGSGVSADMEPEAERPDFLPESLHRQILTTTESARGKFADIDMRQGFALALLGDGKALEDYPSSILRANAVLMRALVGCPPPEGGVAFLEGLI